jgi:hypothetical protein
MVEPDPAVSVKQRDAMHVVSRSPKAFVVLGACRDYYIDNRLV